MVGQTLGGVSSRIKWWGRPWGVFHRGCNGWGPLCKKAQAALRSARGQRWALRLARPVHRLRGDAKTTPVACLGHGLRCRRRGNNARGGGNGDRLRTAQRLDARVWGNIYNCIITNVALRGMRILLWPHYSAIVGSLSVYGQAR